MIDPFLIDLMSNSGPKSKVTKQPPDTTIKNDTDPYFDEIIKEEVDRLMELHDVSTNQLISPEVRRTKIEHEVREKAQHSEFRHYLAMADKIMRNEGSNYLEKSDYDGLLNQLNEISQNVHDLDLKEVTEESLQAALAMQEEHQASILKIGIEKYKQGLLEESIAIFTYLTTVAATELDYWYRLGLVAQKAEKYALAIEALNAVSDLDPDFVGSYLYRAECYLHQKMDHEAQADIDKAKIILKTTNEEEKWHAHLLEIEELVAKIS
ncbi:MAG TPA: tetratricopeptide repeat protein [Parachlamydiaceae bacterium]|nr:tetratricopeptide repeat protein [Parachlamydiaceae bacterium]